MKLKVIQNSIGHYNWANQREKSLAFSMAIYDGDKIYEENGIKAKISYSGSEEEESDFSTPFIDIEYVFGKCFEHANKIISSTDYEAQTMLFARMYQKHYEELNENLLKEKRERIEKKIAELTAELEKGSVIYDLADTVNACVNKEISKYEKYIKGDKEELAQLIPDTEKHIKLSERINKWQRYIDNYKSQLITE